MRHLRFTIISALLLSISGYSNAQQQPFADLEASVTGSLGSGDFAPYYISSNNHGVLTQTSNALLRLKATSPLRTEGTWGYGFGVDVITGLSSSTDYSRYNATSQSWYNAEESAPNLWLQQLYFDLRYRSVFLTVGLKEHESALVDHRLSSGDLIESGNARPIPEARVGFVEFQDIPFTNGWVQIQGEIGYGKATDSDWLRDHFNYYNNFITTDWWYTYKRAYFRTNPSKPLSVIVGAQAAGQFAGNHVTYTNGVVTATEEHKLKFRDFFDMFIPKTGEEGFVKGNHLGSWDFKARYRLPNADEISAYAQWPWEDGSGIGKLNGFDGVWGLQYNSADKERIINGAVVEYIDFTNQSGPMHWDPEDNPGTTLRDQATGADDYYNNFFFNGYAHHGMSIGTPFLRSTLYNTNGVLRYLCNRVRGFHLGVSGYICPTLDYRLLFSYRKGWGSAFNPLIDPWTDTSMLVECNYRLNSRIDLKGQLSFDAGDMYGDNFGALVTVSYHIPWYLNK